VKFNIKQFITRMSLIARLLITTICTALVLAVALITTPTTSLAAPPAQVRDGTHITIIHLNDTYEILPVSGGRLGGLARVATLKKQLLAQNPNTIMTLSGDYHGPSGMGLAKVNGVPLAGQQAVAVLNKVGIDYSTFGDH
jgi:5'-nucleotidase